MTTKTTNQVVRELEQNGRIIANPDLGDIAVKIANFDLLEKDVKIEEFTEILELIKRFGENRYSEGYFDGKVDLWKKHAK